jgi:hypothetical protein
MRQFNRNFVFLIFAVVVSVQAASAQRLKRAFTITPGGRIEVVNFYGRVEAFTETPVDTEASAATTVTNGKIILTATSDSAILANDVKIVANSGEVRIEVKPADSKNALIFQLRCRRRCV